MKKYYNPDDLRIVKLSYLVQEEIEDDDDDDEYEGFYGVEEYYQMEEKLYIAKVRKEWDPIKREPSTRFYIIDDDIWLNSKEKFPLRKVEGQMKLKRAFANLSKRISEDDIFGMEVELNQFAYGNAKSLSILEDK